MKLLTLALLLAPGSCAASASTHAAFPGSLPAGATLTGSAVDKDGNLLISGNLSASSPVHSFLARFSPDAQMLLFFQHIGRSGTDNSGPVAVDSSGNIYVSGVTGSPDFPTTPGPLQTDLNGASGAGEVFLTGQTVGQFPVSPSPIQPSNAANTFYVLRLSAAGTN
jgi:hypothetical protein